MIRYGCFRKGELLCTDWVSIFKQHSVNKIAFIVLRGEFEAVGSRS